MLSQKSITSNVRRNEENGIACRAAARRGNIARAWIAYEAHSGAVPVVTPLSECLYARQWGRGAARHLVSVCRGAVGAGESVGRLGLCALHHAAPRPLYRAGN